MLCIVQPAADPEADVPSGDLQLYRPETSGQPQQAPPPPRPQGIPSQL